ncbi:MAG: hypothetical protein CMG71_08315 [Candidatus Marinimicrobia bacterium]|nr:hypothetical protein [Candidatus Neomarinimicrobiota bacterium]|tara:strand:- start:2878 stop:3477 length:600 start_codon:yes stop_codon:yes gene_type:complete
MSKQQVQRTPRSQPVLIELKALLAKGQEIGYVTLNDLNKALPSEVNSSEQIEGIVATFSELGIQIVDDDDPEEKSPQSADQDAEKQFDLAVDYDLDGDYKQAVVWYRKAAEQGDAGAQVNLGNAYDFGEGVRKNAKQAVAWYRKSAEQGHAIAQFNLGVHLYYGEGLVQDYDQAMRWWRMAAEQGDLDAAEFVRNKGPK